MKNFKVVNGGVDYSEQGEDIVQGLSEDTIDAFQYALRTIPTTKGKVSKMGKIEGWIGAGICAVTGWWLVGVMYALGVRSWVVLVLAACVIALVGLVLYAMTSINGGGKSG